MNKFNPVHVRDPRTDGYSVIVHPCQDIILTLTDPINLFDKACHEDRWEVKPYSEYFYLAEEKELPGRRQYRFIQYYNLTRWTDVSNVYLGDIDVTLSGKKVAEHYSLCVLARKNSRHQCRIVTAVNPLVNRIKLQTDDVLEVVVCRYDAAPVEEEVWCALYDMGKTGNGSQWLEKVRQETLLLPDSSPLRTDRRSLYFTMSRDVGALPANPGLPKNKELPPIPEWEVQRQHHFWFRIRPEDKQAVLEANKGEAMANIVFNSSVGFCTNLQVLISTREQKTKTGVPEYDKERYEGNYRGLVGRYYSPNTGLLCNPGKIEGVEILAKQNGVMVELAPPAMTWPAASSANRWAAEVEPVMSVEIGSGKTASKRMSCVELVDRAINQQPIQRFFVKPLVSEIPPGDAMYFLGVVNFFCKDAGVVGKRTVNCWLVHERSEKEEYDELGVERYRDLIHLPSVKKRQGQPATQVNIRPRYTEPTIPYRPRVERIKVHITEERGQGLLTSGCYSLSFSCIKIEKKKNVEVTKITASDYDEYHGISKKKGEAAMGSNNSPRPNHSPHQSRNPKGSGKGSGTGQCPLFSGTAGGSTAGQGSPGQGTAVVSEDPSNYDVITLEPGQHALIRMPIPFWDLKNDVDYFWNVNPIQIAKQHFWIRDIRLMRQGKRIWQEIVLMLNRQSPKDIGLHRVGAVRLHNKHEHRYVLVELKVDTACEHANPEYSQALRDMMAGWRAVGDRRTKEMMDRLKAEKKEAETTTGSLCVLVRDPWPSDRVATVGQNDLIKVVLKKRVVAYGQPGKVQQVDLLDWSLTELPAWLKLTETKPTQKENVFIFAVDRNEMGGVIVPLDKMRFRCGESTRDIAVRLEISYLAGLGS